MLGAYHPLTMWDVVHPSSWFPMTSFEQSIMQLTTAPHIDLPVATYCVMEILPEATSDEIDDFFTDLPAVALESSTAKGVSVADSTDKKTVASFSYSYSSSSAMDDTGCVVLSIRRRYEDANGRLKAVHERRLPGKKMVTMWQRANKRDEGTFSFECSEGFTKEEFEEEWKKTPFAKSHESVKSLEGDKWHELTSHEKESTGDTV